MEPLISFCRFSGESLLPAYRGYDHNMVADRTDLRQNMGAEDHGMILPQLADQITDLDDLFRIQTYRGLIQNNDLRIAEDCLRQSDSLPVTF